VCLKINQYWTGLFVSYSVKTQLHEKGIVTIPALFKLICSIAAVELLRQSDEPVHARSVAQRDVVFIILALRIRRFGADCVEQRRRRIALADVDVGGIGSSVGRFNN